MARDELMQIAVQVNGRLREVFEVLADATPQEVQAQTLALPKVQQHLLGKPVRKIYYIPGKMISIVTDG